MKGKKGAKAEDRLVVRLKDKIKKLEYELSKHKECKKKDMLKSLIHNTIAVFYILDTKGKIVYISKQIKKYGYTPKELTGKKFLNFIYKKDRKTVVIEFIREISSKRQSPPLQFRIIDKKGNPHWVEDLSKTLYEKNKSTGSAGALVDISKIKKKEKEIEQLAKIPEEDPNPILRISNSLTVVYANSSAQKLLKKEKVMLRKKIPRKWQKIVKRTIEDGVTKTYKLKIDTLMYEFSFFPIKGEEYIQVYGSDITEREKSQEIIINEKNLATQYLNIAGVIIVALDNSGNVTLINDKGSKILGYRKEDIIGKNWVKTFVPKPIRREIKNVFDSVLKKDSAKTWTNQIKTKTGQIRTICWQNTQIKDKSGKILGTLSSGEDITLKEKTQEALEQSEKLYRTTINSLNEAIHVIDKDMNIILVNRCCLDWIKKYSLLKRPIGRKITEVFPFLARQMIDEYMTIFKTKKEIESVEESVINNKHVVIKTKKIPLISKGIVRNIVTVLRDITLEENNKRELKNITERWIRTFNSIKDGISIHSRDFVVLDANESIMNILKMKRKDIIGKRCYTLFHDRNDPITQCPLKRTIKTKQQETTEIFEPKLNKWLSVTTSPIFDKENNIKEVVHLVRDITAEKERTDALKKHTYELEKFNKFAIDRELKMIELKKRIKELER